MVIVVVVVVVMVVMVVVIMMTVTCGVCECVYRCDRGVHALIRPLPPLVHEWEQHHLQLLQDVP